MLDVDKLKYVKLSKQEYRNHILDLFEATSKFEVNFRCKDRVNYPIYQNLWEK